MKSPTHTPTSLRQELHDMAARSAPQVVEPQLTLTARLVLALDDMLDAIRVAHGSPEWNAQPFTVQAQLSVIHVNAERLRGELR